LKTPSFWCPRGRKDFDFLQVEVQTLNKCSGKFFACFFDTLMSIESIFCGKVDQCAQGGAVRCRGMVGRKRGSLLVGSKGPITYTYI